MSLPSPRIAFLSLCTLVGALTLAYAAKRTEGAVGLTLPEPPTDRPIEADGRGYVTSDACKACHPGEYDSWGSTYHRTMTQEIGPDTVLADFDLGELEFYGRRFVLEQRGDEFWVELEDITHEGVEGPRPRVWRQLVLSTGSHHFQSYWYPEGDGRKLTFLGICWRIDEQRWVPVHSAFLIPPDLDVPLRGRWNSGCHTCHSVGARPQLKTPHGMDTQVAEFGIACEACHGPGEAHVEANRDPRRRYALHADGGGDPTIVDPSDLSPERESQICGQCHALTDLLTDELKRDWRKDGFTYLPGDDLTESRGFVSDGGDYFWSDGMVRLAGREFTAFLRTPCFVDPAPDERMSCMSCHRMHRAEDDPRPLQEWREDLLEVDMETNLGCVQCHTDYEQPEALAAHTHHAPEGEGSNCYNCHMPHTAWSLLGGIRSHQVSSPTVQESVRVGRPNACNLCHLDQTLAWTGGWLKEWWGTPRPKLDADERDIAAGVLWALRGDAGQRALTAWHMGWEGTHSASPTDWMAPYLAHLLEDPYEAVRFSAVRSLKALPGFEGFEHDFLSAPEVRAAARVGVEADWNAPPGEDWERVLIGSSGVLRSEFQRLSSQRDDTPVVLSE